MKFITLSMIVRENIIRPDYRHVDTDPSEDGEDDGLVEAGGAGEASAQTAEIVNIGPRHEILEVQPLTLQVEQIRSFYPRKNAAPGTRVVLKSGTAYIVKQTHDEVLAEINRLG